MYTSVRSSLCSKRHTWPLILHLKSQREIFLNLEQLQRRWRGCNSPLCSKAVRGRDYAARPAGGAETCLSWASNAKKSRSISQPGPAAEADLWLMTQVEHKRLPVSRYDSVCEGCGFYAPALNTRFSSSNCDGSLIFHALTQPRTDVTRWYLPETGRIRERRHRGRDEKLSNGSDVTLVFSRWKCSGLLKTQNGELA